MQYAISAGTLVLRSGLLLLVHHQGEGFDFWVPPGGRLRGEESILDCAVRETHEETGLRVVTQRIVYVEEFVEKDLHFCKFWILAEDPGGRLNVEGLDSDDARAAVARSESGDDHVVNARFVSRDEMQAIPVYPRILRDTFWQDLAQDFPEARHLGLQHIEP
jgi:ADP-ribose pyrophosphatase YjhB (NUDIX family)